MFQVPNDCMHVGDPIVDQFDDAMLFSACVNGRLDEAIMSCGTIQRILRLRSPANNLE